MTSDVGTVIFDNGQFWIESHMLTIDVTIAGAQGFTFSCKKPGKFVGGSVSSGSATADHNYMTKLVDNSNANLTYGKAISQFNILVWQPANTVQTIGATVLLFFRS